MAFYGGQACTRQFAGPGNGLERQEIDNQRQSNRDLPMHRRNPSQRTAIAGRQRSRRRSRLSRQSAKSLTGIGAAMVLVGIAALANTAGDDNQAVDETKVSSISRTSGKSSTEPVTMAARPIPICGQGRRSTCIVDGDTFWLEGTKYRIANIDTPELKGKCSAENNAAKHARDRLRQFISAGPVALTMTGTDPYGRTLVLVSGPDGDIGEKLVAEGLAEVWGGAFIDWCSG